MADGTKAAQFLEGVPALSTCSHDVLEEFASHGMVSIHSEAGATLCVETHHDDNIYVVLAGTATLIADDVLVRLEPGDYFGGTAGRHDEIVASVIGDGPVSLVVLHPEDVAHLVGASARRRHPSSPTWVAAGAPETRRLAAVAG